MGVILQYAMLQGVFVAGHVSRIYGPVQALVNYLRASKARFHFLSLPFSYSGMDRARVQTFSGGRETASQPGHACQGPEPLLWIKDFLFVLVSGWRSSRHGRIPLFIGIDNLNAAAGVLLRMLGRVDCCVYYVIDYTPRRFSNPLFNGLYHAVDRFCASRCDQIWNLSSRMREIREKQGVPPSRNKVVPVGVALKEVVHPARSRVKRKRLVYMGSIERTKGIQLLIECMPELTRRVPGLELHIFGTGPFEGEMKALVAASPARKRIFQRGGLDHAKLFAELPRYGVALAPYLEEPGSITYWADATKPKEYLACGLPLIVTKVPWIWERVADRKYPMGLAISYNGPELVAACARLLGDASFYWRCRRNALAFASTLEWKTIYDKAFRELRVQRKPQERPG